MAEEKRYYWLKLKRDFFKRHDVRIIEAMPNGKDYILFYLKLLLESVDHEGKLRFNDTIPYNEQMISVVTETNIDIVRSALKVFSKLDLVSVLDDQTIYMHEVEKLIGSETEWAKKKRLYREKVDGARTLSSPCPTSVHPLSDKSKSIDTEQEREIIHSERNAHACARGEGAHGCVFLTDEEREELYNRLGAINAKQYIKRLDQFIFEKGATVADHFNMILKWWEEDKE